MMNQTYVFETEVVESKQWIDRITLHNIRGVPITPPPYRDRPKTEGALLLEVETNDGIVGYATSGYAHHSAIHLMTEWVAPRIIEAKTDPFRTDHIASLFDRHTWERALGRMFTIVLSMVDIACWDIKGKTLGKPVHHLLGGARDRVPVYVTHGAAYEGALPYSREELAAEAKFLAEKGVTHLKNTVGRQRIPDPVDDYHRMAAMRDAVGPDVQLSMDGNLRMNLAQAMKLCQMCEELGVSFIEEPIHYNDPRNLHHLRLKTTIPVAAGENEKFSTLQILQADGVDFLQPNVNNDGGYTAAMRNAAISRAFNVPLSHGNGNGPHNIALHAGLQHGGLVEYHFHKWMAYNAMFKAVPQPENGWLTVSQEPGLGLEPRDGLIEEFAVRS